METRSRKKLKLGESAKGKEKADYSYSESEEEYYATDSEADVDADGFDDATSTTGSEAKAPTSLNLTSGSKKETGNSTTAVGHASMLTNKTETGPGKSSLPQVSTSVQSSTAKTTTSSTIASQKMKPGATKSETAAAGPSKGRSVAYYIQRELSDLANMDDTDILVAPESEDNLNVIKSVILGSCDTPYAFGFFHFRGTYPTNYPNVAPSVVITTTEHGRVRFNPNLYADGKVCLSILGTWRGEAGEQWSSAQSTYTILRSIQSLLHSMPYVNEPGFEDLKKEGSKVEAEKYNLKLAHETIRVAVCWVMDNVMDNKEKHTYCSSYPFQYILKHWFLFYYDIYLQRCEEALKDSRCADGMQFMIMPFEGGNNTTAGKFMYTRLIQRLKNIKKLLDEEEEQWIKEGKKLTANRSSSAQHLDYERLKFNDSCPDGISASPEEDNMFVWTASIFDRLGPYDGGCFQVRLVFSKNYTEGEPPRVRFLSPVFHPQITATDYRPRLSYRLPASRKGMTILSILEECQAILQKPPTPDPMLHVNPAAAKLLRENPAAFAKKVRNDGDRSLEAM